MSAELRRLRLAVLAGAFIAGALVPAGAGVERWTPFGPGNGSILAFAVAPGLRGTLYASHEFGGVFQSTDAGLSWRPAGRGLEEEIVTDLAASASLLYAVTEEGEVFTNSPGRPVWRRVHDGSAFEEVPFEDLLDARLAAGPGVLYLAAGGSGLFRSQDGGRSWERVLEGDPPVAVAVVDARTPSHVYAGLEGAPSVLRSTDGGETWSSAGLPPGGSFPGGGIQALVLTDPSTVVAASGAPGLFRSTDGGDTWQAIELRPGGPSFRVSALAVDPALPSTVRAFEEHGVFVSRDGGATWAFEGTPPFTFAQALAVDPQTGMVFSASQEYVARTNRGGHGWRIVYRPGFDATHGGVEFDPVDPSTVYLPGERLLRSTDAGRTWANFGGPLGASPNQQIRDLLFDPESPSALYAATDGGIFFSADRGSHWRQLVAPSGLSLAWVERGTLLAGGCGMSRSADGGSTWSEVFECAVPTPTGDDIRRYVGELLVDPQNPNRVYAEVEEQEGRHPGRPTRIEFRLYSSENGGRTWRQSLIGSRAAAFDPSRPWMLYAVKAEGVFRSVDAGKTWRRIGGSGLSGTATDLRIDPVAPATFYVSTIDAGVFRSTNRGVTWTAFNAGLDPSLGTTHVSRLSLHPSLPHHVYAAAGGRLFEARFDR